MLGWPGSATAQDYPQKPIRMIVPFAAGGGTDVLARIVANGLAERMKTQVVVENRAGAGSVSGTDAVAKAAPDGYTILYNSVAYAINPGVYKRLPYAPADLVPVALAGSAPLVLVAHPSVPAKDLKELIALFRSKPGEYNYGSSGNGTTLHMAAEMFRSMAKVDIVHVPYRGAAPAMTDLIGGRVALVFDQVSTAAPLVEGGQLKAIAVTTRTRSNLLPNTPTLDEAGLPGYETYTWNVVAVPRGTPQPIIDRLNREIVALMGDAPIRKRYDELGAETSKPLSPSEVAAFVKSETDKFGAIAREAGVSIE
ncbi:tripartite tricarboxylate transporter substrate binding protein [Bosea sp. (in: a-proteobacteria)]|uniref:tripartite tricarboxylate transporter substrate binding protein n=1 Tax=Bosea sp. (in: a-proteobacteria) TaxID=1871050 RepID=UPI002DDD2604|nr:tripartite tricarboxylate transporter substrate binding protein [Bosea sp. (in: a-proteobacteria)]HEV2512106.1 tripartite tricarboxylate transporter substrate binding protein [Bosea sp. (in: a-proteobacteria)]